MSEKKDYSAFAATLPGCPFCGAQPDVEPWHGGKPTKVMISCPGTYANSVMGAGRRRITCRVAPSVTGETPALAKKYWSARA